MSGSSAAVRQAAQIWRDSGAGATGVASAMTSLDVETWEGLAAERFTERRRITRAELDEQGRDLTGAGAVLSDYADEMADCDLRIDDARARMRAAWTRVFSVPPDLSALDGLIAAQRELSVVRFERERKAIHAAEALFALIARDTTELASLTWPPEGWPPANSLGDSPLAAAILANATFDPEDVSQGGVGNCYLLASLMALMQSDAGDQILRDNLRWDPDRDGYWVTLYDDGEPVTYFVDRSLARGATENGGPGVASIYEAALKEHLGFTDLNNGGWPVDTFPMITGLDANEYKPRWFLGMNDGAIRADLAGGHPGVASTTSIDSASPEFVTVGRTAPDGTVTTETVEIVGPHAYALVSLEPDGSAWVMNPWGAGNGADGGGPFRVSADDFDRLFTNVATGAIR